MFLLNKNINLKDQLTSLGKILRQIYDNPTSIIDNNVFPEKTKFILDYFYDHQQYRNPEILKYIEHDAKTYGVFSPTDNIFNAFNLITNIEKTKKLSNGAVQKLSEQINLQKALLNNIENLLQTKENAAENEQAYLNAPNRIKEILKEIGITEGKTLDTITAHFSSTISENRTYKISHADINIALEEAKKEGKSLSSSQIKMLGIAEMEEEKIKLNNLKKELINIISNVLKLIAAKGNRPELREKILEINELLTYALTELPNDDFYNIKEHKKCETNIQQLTKTRREELLKIKSTDLERFTQTIQREIKFVYNELIYDNQTKSMKFSETDSTQDMSFILTKDYILNTIVSLDNNLHKKILDSLIPPFRICFFPNPGPNYYNKNLNRVIIHNYLLNQNQKDKKTIADIGRALAQALINNDRVLLEKFTEYNKKNNVNPNNDSAQLFIEQYTICFCEKYFSLDSNSQKNWDYFKDTHPDFGFFIEKYFK